MSCLNSCNKAIKDERNLVRLKAENKVIQDIRTLFESKEEDYYKAVRIGNAFCNDYIGYESNNDESKALSIKEFLEEIKQQLEDNISILKKSDSCKIQLTIAISFMPSKDSDKKRVMHLNK